MLCLTSQQPVICKNREVRGLGVQGSPSRCEPLSRSGWWLRAHSVFHHAQVLISQLLAVSSLWKSCLSSCGLGNCGVLRGLLRKSPVRPKNQETVNFSFFLSETISWNKNALVWWKRHCHFKERNIKNIGDSLDYSRCLFLLLHLAWEYKS